MTPQLFALPFVFHTATPVQTCREVLGKGGSGHISSMVRTVIVIACALLTLLVAGCDPEAQIVDPRERPEQNVRLFVDGST